MQGVRAALKASTAAAHSRVEVALGLLDPALTPSRLAGALAVLYGFWAPNEPALDAWASASPGLSARLDWPRRRRAGVLHDDLVALGAQPAEVARATVVVHGTGDAEALAWLYVAEGSTLGGAVIHRALAASGSVAAPASFVPYAEGPGRMWRSYLDTLDTWAGADAARPQRVVTAAVRIFGALADWAESEGPEVSARGGAARAAVAS